MEWILFVIILYLIFVISAGRFKACLGGLRLRLHERLRPEPCQTVEIAPAPGVEPELKPLAASRLSKGGGATFWWLHLAPTRNPPE
jgi:hypothetical protein